MVYRISLFLLVFTLSSFQMSVAQEVSSEIESASPDELLKSIWPKTKELLKMPLVHEAPFRAWFITSGETGPEFDPEFQKEFLSFAEIEPPFRVMSSAELRRLLLDSARARDDYEEGRDNEPADTEEGKESSFNLFDLSLSDPQGDFYRADFSIAIVESSKNKALVKALEKHAANAEPSQLQVRSETIESDDGGDVQRLFVSGDIEFYQFSDENRPAISEEDYNTFFSGRISETFPDRVDTQVAVRIRYDETHDRFLITFGFKSDAPRRDLEFVLFEIEV